MTRKGKKWKREVLKKGQSLPSNAAELAGKVKTKKSHFVTCR